MALKTGFATALALLLAGCGGVGGGRMWVPQGPGEYPEARAPREAAPRATQQAAAAQRPAAPATATASASSPAVSGGYTQATRYGDLLFVSGQIALDAGGNLRGVNAEEQTRQVMENIRAILEANRLTLANVVSATVYMKDLNDFRGMDAAYETFFKSALPARSILEVARLPRNALVEISVVAGR